MTLALGLAPQSALRPEIGRHSRVATRLALTASVCLQSERTSDVLPLHIYISYQRLRLDLFSRSAQEQGDRTKLHLHLSISISTQFPNVLLYLCR